MLEPRLLQPCFDVAGSLTAAQQPLSEEPRCRGTWVIVMIIVVMMTVTVIIVIVIIVIVEEPRRRRGTWVREGAHTNICI